MLSVVMYETAFRVGPGDFPACSLQLAVCIASEYVYHAWDDKYFFHFAGANGFGNKDCQPDEINFTIGNRHPTCLPNPDAAPA